MNKYLFFIMTAFMLTIQKGYCVVESVSPELQDSLKTPTNEPNFFTILFALAVVIGLIYITGIIYSKLNLVGAKTVKEQLKHADLNRAVVLSTTQLGQNKNLHVIELNDKRYLIGATANSINLIKDLGENTEVQESKTAEKVEKQSEEDIDKAIKYLYGKGHEQIIETSQEDEEFDIHKKYL